MRLGIPGSIASTRPDHDSCFWKNTGAEAEKLTDAFAVGVMALATVHMVQHFMQLWSSVAGVPASSGAG